MKICPKCGYVEHWGSQKDLVCENCDQEYLEAYNKIFPESACNSDSSNIQRETLIIQTQEQTPHV